MRRLYDIDAGTGQLTVQFDYKAEQANRGTPARRRKYNRVERNRQCKWSDGNRGGAILKRLFR